MAEPPHVLIPLHQLGGGGVERVTLHLANGFARRGNRVTLVLLKSGGVLEERIDGAVDLIRLSAPSADQRGVGLLRAAAPLARLIRERSPDLLLSPGNHMHPLALLAQRQAKAPACGLALKFTNPIERRQVGPMGNAFRRGFFRYAADRAKVVLTLSRAAHLQALRLAPAAVGKVKVVDNPYVEERLFDRTGHLGAKKEPPLLLSVGRLTAQKDPLMLLEAMSGLKDRAWRLAMLGEGPLRAECEVRAQALGIADRVDFPGFVVDPAGWFDRARVFVLPSRYEELPAVLFEAMVAGCAIVSTAASPSVEDLLGEGRGRLVPSANPAAFRAAVAAALDDPSPPPAAEDWVSRFTIGNGVASHAQALELL